MDILSLLFSILPLVFSCLFLAAITELIRRAINYQFPEWSKSHLFQDLLLPSLPTLMGMTLGALAKGLPTPEGFSSLEGRIILGATAGLLSSHVYRWVKAALKRKIESDNS